MSRTKRNEQARRDLEAGLARMADEDEDERERIAEMWDEHMADIADLVGDIMGIDLGFLKPYAVRFSEVI